MADLEPYYRRQAEFLVDALYDKGFLDQQLARESFRTLEEFIGGMVEMYCTSAVRADRLLRTIKNRDRSESPHG